MKILNMAIPTCPVCTSKSSDINEMYFCYKCKDCGTLFGNM